MMGIVEINRRFGHAEPYPLHAGLFLLMSILSQTLFALVRCHFVLLSFLTAWHSIKIFAPSPVAWSLKGMTCLKLF